MKGLKFSAILDSFKRNFIDSNFQFDDRQQEQAMATFGEKWEEILNGSYDESTAKTYYYATQQSEYRKLFDSAFSLTFNGRNEEMFDSFDSESFNRMVEYNIENMAQIVASPEDAFDWVSNILSGYIKELHGNSEDSPKRVEGFKRLLDSYVSAGYDLSAVQLCLKQKEKQMTEMGISPVEQHDFQEAYTLMNNAEYDKSPYNSFFRQALEIGKLSEKMKSVEFGSKEYEQLEDRLFDTKETVRKYIADYELCGLTQVIATKRSLVRESDPIMYEGLRHIALVVKSEQQRQTRKVEQNKEEFESEGM